MLTSVPQTDRDDCTGAECEHGGACVDLVGDYQCQCQPGYTGKNCETNIDECAVSPCRNGGTCTDLVAGYTCTCSPGWEVIRTTSHIPQLSCRAGTAM